MGSSCLRVPPDRTSASTTTPTCGGGPCRHGSRTPCRCALGLVVRLLSCACVAQAGTRCTHRKAHRYYTSMPGQRPFELCVPSPTHAQASPEVLELDRIIVPIHQVGGVGWGGKDGMALVRCRVTPPPWRTSSHGQFADIKFAPSTPGATYEPSRAALGCLGVPVPYACPPNIHSSIWPPAAVPLSHRACTGRARWWTCGTRRCATTTRSWWDKPGSGRGFFG